MRFLIGIGILLGLTACGEDLNCEELTAFEASAELGQGEQRFSAIGTQLEVHYGNQGGQHVFLAAQFTGLRIGNKRGSDADDQPPQVNFRLSRDGETVSETFTFDRYPTGDSLDSQLVGVPLTVGYDESGEFTLTMEAVDSCGNLAVDERVVSLSY